MARPTRRTIGNYEIEKELGRGGMGVVHLAHQTALERPAVLKTLRRGLSDDPSLAERFRREARAAAGIHHQNIVAVYDCFSWRNELYIAQEYVDGNDLASVLQVVRRLDPRPASLIALELARGLEEIHARGVVHRDLKPANVLLGRSGEAKIADFGIALEARGSTLTEFGAALGTRAYMAPEQLRGERADARSDVFAFGTLLYEMVTGSPPFPDREDESEAERVRRLTSGRLPAPRRLAPGLPRAMARLIRDCLRPRPRRRPDAAAALRIRLEALLGSPAPSDCRAEIAAWLWERGVFEAAPDETCVTPREPAVRRRGGFSRAAGLATCAAALAGIGLVRLGVHDPGPAVEAPQRAAWVRFEAAPGTRVRIDGRGAFAAERAAATRLAPGSHEVVFEHPAFGRAARRIAVAPGEERVVRHAFESAGPAP